MLFIWRLSGNSGNCIEHFQEPKPPTAMCLIVINRDKVIELFYDMDNFVKEMQVCLVDAKPKTGPAGCLSTSEMMAITALYHFSGMKCFKFYYAHFIKGMLRGYFPDAPCYQRFVAMKHLLRGQHQASSLPQQAGKEEQGIQRAGKVR